MTSNEKKELVRKQIINANSSILDLKMGCEVQLKGYDDHIYTIVANCGVCHKHKKCDGNKDNCDVDDGFHLISQGGIYDDYGFLQKDAFPEDILKIIGRPIQLQDVLITTAHSIETPREITGFQIGERFKEYDSKLWQIVCKWDWEKDDFDHQSEETIVFLWSLLCE